MKFIKPSIVLVKPQLPENIGLVARAMENCSLKDLIIVNPREKWPNEIAIQASANSRTIIEKSKLFKTTEEALFDFNFVIATSARKRFLQKPFQNDLNQLFNQFPINKKTAILFGPENSGICVLHRRKACWMPGYLGDGPVPKEISKLSSSTVLSRFFDPSRAIRAFPFPL